MQVNYGNNNSEKNALLEQAIRQYQGQAPQQGGGQASPEDMIKQRIQQALLKQHTAKKPPTLESIGKGFEKNVGEGIAQTANYLLNSPRGQKITGALMASQSPEFGKAMYQSGTALEADYRQQEQAAQLRNQQQVGLAMQYLRDEEAKRKAEAKAAAAKKKGKSPNESQSKDNLFYNRTKLAEQELNKLEEEGYDPSSWQRNPFTQQGRRYEQAKENFLTATLRDLSGAAIGSDEYKREEKIYFPKRGDGPEIIEQKRIARQVAIDGLKEGAGPAFKDLIKTETMKTISPKKGKGETSESEEIVETIGRFTRVN